MKTHPIQEAGTGRHPLLRWRFALGSIALAAALSACGGGDSGDGASTSLDGAGASARDVPLASADLTALLKRSLAGKPAKKPAAKKATKAS